MSSSEEDEGVYEIERILAEKVSEQGVFVYLVKWKGYDDEQCTWEPAEHFDDEASLAEWVAQKASGDALDAYDLRRIQHQMDVFNAGQEEATGSEIEDDDRQSHTSSMDLDEVQQRARRRLKLVS